MDESFIKKVYRSVALIWIIAMIWAFAFEKPLIALNITLGMALGTFILYSYEYVIRKAFVPGAKKPGRALLKLGLVKYPVVIALLYWMVRWEHANFFAFCGGIVLVHFALLAKLAGMHIVERREKQGDKSGVPLISVRDRES